MGVPASKHGKKAPRIKIPGAPHNSGIRGVGTGGRIFTGVGGKRPRGSSTTENVAPPVWVAGGIPDQSDAAGDQPLSLSVAQYLEKGSNATNFELVTPPAGFYISSAGKITVSGAAPAAHSITVTAINMIGTTNDTFTWTIS